MFKSGIGRGGVDRPSSRSPTNLHEIRRQPPRMVDQPRPGFYLARMVPKGPMVAARIVLDRGLWWAEVNGVKQGEPNADPLQAPLVGQIYLSRPVSEDEYLRRLALASDPQHPCHWPWTPVDLNALPPTI